MRSRFTHGRKLRTTKQRSSTQWQCGTNTSKHIHLSHDAPRCSDAHHGPSSPRAAVTRSTTSTTSNWTSTPAPVHMRPWLQQAALARPGPVPGAVPPAVYAASTCPPSCHSNAVCLRLQAVARPARPCTQTHLSSAGRRGEHLHAEPELAGRGRAKLGMPSVVCPVACDMRSALSPPGGSV